MWDLFKRLTAEARLCMRYELNKYYYGIFKTLILEFNLFNAFNYSFLSLFTKKFTLLGICKSTLGHLINRAKTQCRFFGRQSKIDV